MIARITKLSGAVAVAAATLLVLAVPSAQTGGSPKCFGKPATIVRGGGDDNIKGTNANDVIVAGNGENDIDGKGGNDRICGGNDGDDIFGGKGNDKMASGGNIDFIAGREGNDLHIAGGGDDQIDAVQDATDDDEDRAIGKKGDDFIDTNDGEDNDTTVGGKGNNDECPADAGDDVDCEIT